MQKTEQSQFIERTKAWLEQTVIGLNLCPFAKAPYMKQQIRYQVSMARDAKTLLADLRVELLFLMGADPFEVETSLLIHPFVLQDFVAYKSFLDLADAAIAELDLEGELQVASFHPDYQFAGTQPQDVENFTNRSPYPMLHILREDSIERAIKTYPNVENIPDRNIQLLRSLGAEDLAKVKARLS